MKRAYTVYEKDRMLLPVYFAVNQRGFNLPFFSVSIMQIELRYVVVDFRGV